MAEEIGLKVPLNPSIRSGKNYYSNADVIIRKEGIVAKLGLTEFKVNDITGMSYEDHIAKSRQSSYSINVKEGKFYLSLRLV